MTREEAIKGLKALRNDFSGYKPNEEMFDMAITALEQPEQKKGKWVRGDQEKMIGAQRCSVCNQQTYKGSTTFNYCPNCGAKMEVEHEAD